MRTEPLWLTGAAVAAFLPQSALAQTATSVETAAPTAAAATDDYADETAIVVTARRREENQQDVPVSVSALSPQMMEARGIDRVDDLQFGVPALRIAPQISAVTPNFVIRGQGRPLFTGALPAVVTYFADVPLMQDGSIVPLYDLASVQVLKGPQGTLFGRNTTGGAILLTPKKPDSTRVEGYAEVTLGNYDTRNFSGAVNAPIIIDKLALRIAADLARRDGFVKKLSGDGTLGNRNTSSFRASLLFKPSDRFENVLVADYTRIQENGNPIVPTAIFTNANGNPLGLAASATNRPFFFGNTLDTNIAMQLAQVQAAGRLVSNPGIDTYVKGDIWGIVNTTTFNVTDDVLIKNIFGYRSAKIYDRLDIDGLPASINDRINGFGQFPQVASDSLTNELQVQGSLFDKAVDFVVGGFYMDEGPTGTAGTQALQFYRAGSPPPVVQNNYIRNKSKAIFGQATWHVGGVFDGLNLTAGYRHTWDNRSFCVFQQVTPVAPDACGGATRKTKSNAPSYTFTADYQLIDQVMVYVTHRRGYRGGGINTNIPVDFPTAVYKPETVKDYEGGFKSDWRFGDVRARLNFAYFRNNVFDYQQSAAAALPLPGGGTLNSTIVANAAKAHMNGYEIEFMLMPVRGMTLSANYDKFHGKFDEFTAPPGFPTAGLVGAKFGSAPHTLNLNARYEFDAPGSLGGSFALSGNYHWRDETLLSVAPAAPQKEVLEPSWDTIDLRAEWNSIADSGFNLALFVRNLADTRYRTGMANSAAVFSVASSYFGDPRTYGAQLKYTF